MMRNGNILTTGFATILHSLVVPIFALCFLAMYQPYGIQETLKTQDASFTFNLTILFCIVFLSISIMRVWLYIIGRYKHVGRAVYAVWCFGEMLVSALFAALYMSLMTKGATPYFDLVGSSYAVLLSAAAYPYAFIWLGLELYHARMEEAPAVDESALMRFYDEYHKLRLVIASESIVFIKSEDNYVQIYYVDQGRIKKFVLRSSMRSLEEQLTKKGMIRCHRSYFINPSYVSVVRKNSAGLIVAQLKFDNLDSIPISRKYQQQLDKFL